jgi:predicted thioredoxin/glutaredoxin
MNRPPDDVEEPGPNSVAIDGFTGDSKRNLVSVYSRHNCHLCDVAFETLTSLQDELDFDLTKLFIDGDVELERKYGEQVPVILIDGEQHDFWRVNPERFRSSLERHRQRR